MENCESTVHQQTSDDSRRRRVSTRQAERARNPATYRQCPCCRDDQVPNLQAKRKTSAAPANPPLKRKRTSVAPPSEASVEHSEVLNLVPRPRSPIPDADLPVASHWTPRPQPSTAPVQDDSPLRIHNYSCCSMEEYQQIYHEVVDDMLKDENGRDRPYSLELGRRIKQKLWERLNRPTFTMSANEEGLLHIEESHGVGVSPPNYDVDISHEPKPRKPSKKRAKKY